MILHLTTGSMPVEVHVHGEFGETEHITVAPRVEAPATTAPAPARGRPWLLAAIPVAAVLAGVGGYQMGATAPGQDARRLAAYHNDDLRLPQQVHGTARSSPEPIPRTIPRADATAAAPPEVPAAVAQLLAQPPAVTPPQGVSIPATASQPTAGSGRNPFGLE